MEVVREAGQHRAGGRALPRRSHRARNPHRRPLPGREVPLGGELAVSLADDPARDPQLPRQRPARGQSRTGGEATGLDVLPDRLLDLFMQGKLGLALDLYQHAGATNWTIITRHYWHCIPDQSIRTVLLP